jgi:PAS domain-containing protein
MGTYIVVNDRMQRGYRYEVTEPEGRNFDSEFRPELQPAEMLRLGVFGGKYITDCREEFPKGWYVGAKLASGPRDPALNFFGVHASQPLSVWQAKGWIHPDDPRGWFQWYCRYYMGRRMPDEDRRQIRRWRAMRRHIRQVERACERGDFFCRPRQRQALLHWAYDSRLI